MFVSSLIDAKTDGEKKQISEKCPIGYHKNTTLFIPSLILFSFNLLCPLCLHLAFFYPSCRDPLPSCFLFFNVISFLLSSHFPCLPLPPYLSIFTHCPPPPILRPSLPLCLWLSSSDRLLMQALYESISPSAVVELAPLLSRQDLFISLPT